MTYRVQVTNTAQADLRRYYRHAAEAAPETASSWLERFEQALLSLQTNPGRCAIAPESQTVPTEVRQLIFGRGSGTYRVLFAICEDDAEVHILHIRRGAMAPAGPGDWYE